jgi:serine/threonine protein kinase
VIAFLLLCDEKPFKGKTRKEAKQNILRCNYNFSAPIWNNVSQAAKDFVSSLLVYDQEERLSAEAALRHPWLNDTQLSSSQVRRSSQHLLEDVRENILAYARASELKKIASMVVAHKSSSAEILDMRRAFDKVRHFGTFYL